jgi:hypothetical protein
LCPPWAPCAPPSHRLEGNEDPFLDLHFSQEELEYAIANLRISSSPGPDRIDYRMISHLPGRGRTIILELFNQMYEERTYPTEWSQYEIFFIKKADGAALSPISLASCLCKLLERLVNNRLLWWLKHHQKLPGSQFGFRKGKSCTDNLRR